MIDLRTWKTEHQLALAGAAAMGFIPTALIAAVLLSPERHSEFAFYCEFGHSYCTYFWAGYWGLTLLWGAIGAFCGAGIAFVTRLLLS
jgi:hypothetical protein